MSSGVAESIAEVGEGDKRVVASNANVVLKAAEVRESGVDYVEMRFYGFDLKQTDCFRLRGELSGGGFPKLSPDGSMIALHWQPGGYFDYNEGLSIFNREGDLVVHYKDTSSHTNVSWEWMSNSRIMIGEKGGMYTVDLSSDTTKQDFKQFDGYKLGETLSISPDGSSLVFNMLVLSEGTYATLDLYTMDLDSGEIKRLIAQDEEDSWNERDALWSEDGNTLLIRQTAR